MNIFLKIKEKLLKEMLARNPWNDALDVRVAQAFSTPIGQFQVIIRHLKLYESFKQ